MSEFWLFIVILAHLFYALVFIIDKYVLSRAVPHPVIYAFYVGILSIFVWVLAPFGLLMPSLKTVILCLLAGTAQVGGWLFFYRALRMGEVSRVVPFVGSFVAVFILILSSLFLGEKMVVGEIVAFMLLVLGSLIIAVRIKEYKHMRSFVEGVPLVLSIAAAMLFASFWILTKYVFIHTSFVSGTIWIRTGVAFIALLLILSKNNRRLIFKETEKTEPSMIKFFFAGRILTIFAGFFMYLAVFLGSVTLTNSLQGLQYSFIFILALIFFKKIPGLKEEFNKETIIQKVIAIILISAGLFTLIL